MSFPDAAQRYLAVDGYAPIALPKGEKHPPPTGFTGKNGKCADSDQIAAWARSKQYGQDANLACWFGTEITVDGVVYQLAGIDVDHYGDKHGGDQLQTLVEKLGPLPATWTSSARIDGVSGIRWYLVPLHDDDGSRIELRGKADQAIEVIYRGYRYAVVWPSHNPKSDSQYWWFPPGVALTNEGKTGSDAWRDSDDLPDPKTFPVLPESWVTYLRKHRSHSGEIDLTIGVNELAQWATEIFNAGGIEDACRNVANALTTWKRKISEDESSHDKITDAHWMLYRLGAEAHTGWQWAVAEIEKHWSETVLRSGKRDPGSASAEIFRSWTGALRKIKVQVDYDGVKAECDCSQPNRVDIQGIPMNEIVQCLADVEPATVQWLWRPWIPLGKLTILEGDSGVAKSTMTMHWAAIASQGKSWPLTTVNGVPQTADRAGAAGVVLVGIEDDENDTIVPRLIAADADRSRVFTMAQPVDDKGNPVPFVIPEDIDRLRRAIELTNARLVVIDPITAFLSTKQVKAGDDPSTRQALMPLVNLARETRCAIVLIRHLNKSVGMSAKHRGSGTVAYTALARSVILAGELKDADSSGATHAIARTKGNLSRDPDALGYVLKDAPGNPDISTMQWAGSLDINANQLAGADSAKDKDARKKAPMRQQCEDVLRELLANGPMRADEAREKTLAEVGCSLKPVNDAADAIGVLKEQVRIDGKISHWTWELPPTVIKLRKRSTSSADVTDEDEG